MTLFIIAVFTKLDAPHQQPGRMRTWSKEIFYKEKNIKKIEIRKKQLKVPLNVYSIFKSSIEM